MVSNFTAVVAEIGLKVAHHRAGATAALNFGDGLLVERGVVLEVGVID